MPTDVWHEPDVLDSLQRLKAAGNKDQKIGQAIRNHLKRYVNTVGAVEWQDRAVDSNVSIF